MRSLNCQTGWRRRLSCGTPGLGGILQFVEIIGRSLRVGSGGEDGALVLLQHLEPARKIGRMILTRRERDAEIRAKERGAKLGNLS
jgi:hypothetical protein